TRRARVRQLSARKRVRRRRRRWEDGGRIDRAGRRRDPHPLSRRTPDAHASVGDGGIAGDRPRGREVFQRGHRKGQGPRGRHGSRICKQPVEYRSGACHRAGSMTKKDEEMLAAADFFNNRIKNYLPALSDVGGVIQFTIEGSGGGTWYADVNS